MLALSVNSKRQRRPNVRLGEIGDVSAAFACGFSQKTKENLDHKTWKPDSLYSQHNELDTVIEFSSMGISPDFFISADSQHNTENKNPNSSKSDFDSVVADEIHMIKSGLIFGTVTRKSRVMKRLGRSREGNNCLFGSAWTQSSKLSPRFTGEDRKEHGEKELMGIGSNAFAGYYPDDVFQDILDHETSANSKDACEYNVDEPGYDGWKDAFYEGNNVFLKSDDAWDQKIYTHNDIASVRGWLEDLGFGRYAGIFEMHEVNEESLPLLTPDDLKEMGIFAVVHRRKLYNAIQRLRGNDSS